MCEVNVYRVRFLAKQGSPKEFKSGHICTVEQMSIYTEENICGIAENLSYSMRIILTLVNRCIGKRSICKTAPESQ